jgi:hypothetical protein
VIDGAPLVRFVTPSYKAVVAACCDAWNWFVSDVAQIASIGTREWVIL